MELMCIFPWKTTSTHPWTRRDAWCPVWRRMLAHPLQQVLTPWQPLLMYQCSSDVSSPGLMCHLAVTPPAADIEGYKGVQSFCFCTFVTISERIFMMMTMLMMIMMMMMCRCELGLALLAKPTDVVNLKHPFNPPSPKNCNLGRSSCRH